jgi:hypothetical protein
MPLYFYDWQDGEVSLVQAANKDAANKDVLDALGPADPEHIRQVRDLASRSTTIRWSVESSLRSSGLRMPIGRTTFCGRH